MTKLPPSIRARLIRYLELGWRSDVIAEEVGCHQDTVYRIEHHLQFWGIPGIPSDRCAKGRPTKLTIAARKALFSFLDSNPTASLHEIGWFLWEEFAVIVHKSTICRARKAEYSRKKAQRVGIWQNDELRRDWKAQCLEYTAEQYVFLDETLVNEATGWRHYAYAPIGQPGRYHADRTRGRLWSILPAYTLDGYLDCTGVKEGRFSGEDYYSWINNELLPHLNAYPAPRSVVVIDNVSIHTNARIEEVFRNHGCRVLYLPPYSPDYNPIELTFSVLKAWIRRYFHKIWLIFQGNFGSFLRFAVARSRCDRFPEAHFRHSGMYIF